MTSSRLAFHKSAASSFSSGVGRIRSRRLNIGWTPDLPTLLTATYVRFGASSNLRR